MAKSAESLSGSNVFGLMTAWDNGNSMPLSEALKVIQNEIETADLTNPDFYYTQYSRLIVLMGDGGMGKTANIKSICRFPTNFPPNLADRNLDPDAKIDRDMLPEYDYRYLNLGEGEAGDFLGIPAQGDFGYMKNLVPPMFPLHKPRSKTGKGILFLDECFTGQGLTVQNILRSIISEKRVVSNVIAPGWALVGATNPINAKYMTTRQIDSAIADRCLVLPVKADSTLWFQWLRKENVIPKEYRNFLMMHESLIPALSQRRWVNMFSLLGSQKETNVPYPVGSDQRRMLVTMLAGETISSALQQFEQYGCDPEQIPIDGKELIDAEPQEHTRHMDRLRRWAKGAAKETERRGKLCAAITAMTVSFELEDRQTEALAKKSEVFSSKRQAANLADFLVNADLVKDLSAMIVGKIKNPRLWMSIRESTKDEATKAKIRDISDFATDAAYDGDSDR